METGVSLITTAAVQLDTCSSLDQLFVALHTRVARHVMKSLRCSRVLTRAPFFVCQKLYNVSGAGLSMFMHVDTLR
jgi:hypothetical protein